MNNLLPMYILQSLHFFIKNIYKAILSKEPLLFTEIANMMYHTIVL
jgi:hypothetical protein